MSGLLSVNWNALFVPHGSLLEVVLRGSVMYLALFALLRILARRHTGTIGSPDLLVIVLIADAAQNGMAGEYRSITEGVLLCGTILGWSALLDWLSFRFQFLRGILESSPLPIVRDGVMLRRNMRQELITVDELMSHLREEGIEDVAAVSLACVEPDGTISVLRRDGSGRPDQGGKSNTTPAP